MPPKVGDTVYVALHNEYDGVTTVAPAIVTYVYGPGDGDGKWWQEAQNKNIVDATVFPRGGAVTTGTYGESEQATVDNGEGGTISYPVGYATTPDGHGDLTPVAPTASGTVTPTAAPTTPQGLSDADIQRLAAAINAQQAAPADTVTEPTPAPAPSDMPAS